MAIAVNSRVRVKLTSAAFTGVSGLLQPQPPLFGRVTSLALTVADVVTEQGDTIQVDTSVLDEITAASADQIAAVLGKVVDGLASPSVRFRDGYIGRVVDVFLSDAVARVLIQSLSNGMYYEMPFTSVTVMGSR